MDFSPQTLATAPHDDVGKFTVSDVSVHGTFADAQSRRRFIDSQQFFVVVCSGRIHFFP
jgi:hypothetical protein